jgi:hypothetical protein
MSSWNSLSLSKKIIIGTSIIAAAVVAPELMILVDVGGVDLALTFLLFYFKPAIEWFGYKKQQLIDEVVNVKTIVCNSALIKPKVFTFNTLYCSVFLLMSGSLIFSLCFYLPALLVNGLAA